MQKSTFAIKLSPSILKSVKEFCKRHGIKYSFFVEKALEEKIEREEFKEDLLDLKQFRTKEKDAVPFEEYLRNFNV